MTDVKIELDLLFKQLYELATKEHVLNRESRLHELHKQINAVERYLAYISVRP